MSQVLNAVQLASTRALYSLVSDALNDVEVQVPSLARAKMDVVTNFIDHVNTNFANIEQGLGPSRAIETEEVDIDGLALVDDELLEAQLAMEGMIAYARNEHLSLLIAFNTRVNSLLDGVTINEASNPLDPEQIAEAFVEALSPLNLVGSQSLNVYRAFNSGVLRKLNQVLDDANQVLIDNDVIPDLSVVGSKKPLYRSRTTRPREADETVGFGRQERSQSAGGGAAGQGQAELFSMLRGLLHSAGPAPGTETTPARGPGSGTEDAGAAVPNLSTAAADQAMDQKQLLTALTQIQQSMARLQPATADEAASVVVDHDRIHRPLAETLQEAQQEGALQEVDQNSSDVISLVSLLYGVIRDDETVPKRINELIDRTQISIAKVALTDNGFFDREDHPARELLNEFASASVGWVEDENFRRDPLYKKIESSVDRILTEHDDNDELFEELLTDFRAFREEESASERRTKPPAPKSAEGDSRAEEAQELVNRTIDERILGRDLDTFTEELLHGPWHRFMVLIALKEGAGSKAWKHAVTTLDVLLWTLQPHEEAEDRTRLETINSRLLNNLRKALKIASLDLRVIDALIARVRELQEASFPEAIPATAELEEIPVIREPSAPREPGAAETGGAAEEAPGVPAGGDTSPTEAPGKVAEPDLEPDIAEAVEHPASTVTEFGAERSGAAGRLADTAREEPADATEAAEPAAAPEPVPEVQPDEGYLRQVDELAVGIWVEFLTGESETTRCKLAAKITAIDKLIFVNRQGVRVVETTRDKLAAELQLGTVRVISDGQLFSRALEAVIGELRESQHEQRTGSAYQPASA